MNFQQTYNRLDPLDPFNLFKGFQNQKNSQKSKGQNESKKQNTSSYIRTAPELPWKPFVSCRPPPNAGAASMSGRSDLPAQRGSPWKHPKKNENVMYIIYLGNPFVNFCRNSISTISNSAEIGCSWVVLICNQSWVRAIPPESWAIPPKLVSNDGIPPKAVLRAKSENSAEIPNGKNFHTFGVLRYTV